MRDIRQALDSPQPAKRWRVLLLTCRDPATDFRLALAQELQALGHDVTYAFLKRRPVVTELSSPNSSRNFSLLSFFYYARMEFKQHSSLIVLNSTNLTFPLMSLLLRNTCGGLWCFDMHDDLLYGSTGAARRKAAIAQRVLLHGSDFVVHAAPTLKELFPASHHLGNASSIARIARSRPQFDRLLILSSLDARLDFDFLAAAAAANPNLDFHIYGQVSQGDRCIAQRLDRLVSQCPNVSYRGPYVNAGLPSILGDYAVSLAPYIAHSPLTRYIDPLRYYHCLNSGMELISTDIPKARDLGDLLHIVHRPDEIGPLMARLANGWSARRNSGSTGQAHHWRNRAITFLNLATDVQAARAKGGGS